MSVAGRYVLGSELARGGMGSVWSARDQVEERDVAIKFQAADLWDRTSDRRFRREADALCRLTHPHVVRFLDTGNEQNLSYIVMELLIGQTLREQLRARGSLSMPEVSSIVAQAALGLSAAHEANIVHRDVKPSNLFMALVEGSQQLKVIDFGIAKSTGLASGEGTASGIVGSPGYMSPEQARGEALDHRTDLWALAVVAFTLLTGREPFTAADVPATLQRICWGEAPSITELSPQLPPALDAFFTRAFEVDRSRRFQSVLELSDCFERACSGQDASQFLGRVDDTRSLQLVGPARIQRAPRPWALLGAAVLATAIVTLAATTRSAVSPKAESPVRGAAVSAAPDLELVVERAVPEPPPRPAPSEPAAASVERAARRPSPARPAVSAGTERAPVTASPPSPPAPEPEAPLELRAPPNSKPADSDALDRRF